jgi:hypothetical protein
MRIAAAVLAAVVSSCTPAFAQAPTPCGDPDALAARLAVKFQEAPTASGADAAGNKLTIYSNPDTGTWTAVLAMPGGAACIVSSGDGWEAIEYALPVAGRPS